MCVYIYHNPVDLFIHLRKLEVFSTYFFPLPFLFAKKNLVHDCKWILFFEPSVPVELYFKRINWKLLRQIGDGCVDAEIGGKKFSRHLDDKFTCYIVYWSRGAVRGAYFYNIRSRAVTYIVNII